MAYRNKLEEVWVPDILGTWTNIGTSPWISTNVIKLNNNLYAFGGQVSASGHAESTKIYSTSWYNPTGWVDTGASFSGLGLGCSVGLVNDTIYCWGSATKTTYWSAPISDPLNWTTTGVTCPSPRNNSALVITENYITMNGGYNGSGLGNILYAPISTPTSLSTGGSISGWEGSGLYLGGEEYHVIGGVNYETTLSARNSRNPISTSFTINGQNYSVSNNAPIFHVGNKVHLLGMAGTQSCTYGEAATIDSGLWQTTTNVLPSASRYVSGGYWVGPDGYAYIVEAYSNFGYIFQSPRRKIYITEPAIPGIYSHRRAITDKGEPTVYTVQCQMGMAPWFTNRRDRF